MISLPSVRFVVTAWDRDGMFKSADELAAARREREAEEAREEFLATPVGAATAAMEEGEAFFEVQLEVGSHIGSAGFGSIDGQHSVSSSARTLGEIERLGWRLEHAGYFFMITGETSTAHVFVSGDNTAVSGVTVGVYLFRNTRLGLPSVHLGKTITSEDVRRLEDDDQ